LQQAPSSTAVLRENEREVIRPNLDGSGISLQMTFRPRLGGKVGGERRERYDDEKTVRRVTVRGVGDIALGARWNAESLARYRARFVRCARPRFGVPFRRCARCSGGIARTGRRRLSGVSHGWVDAI